MKNIVRRYDMVSNLFYTAYFNLMLSQFKSGVAHSFDPHPGATY
jgi:hypothetical protein